METQEVVVISKDSIKKDHRPTLVKWKGENMIRTHSLRATIKEILQVSQVLDVCKVGIIGEPDTGKTTLGRTIAHLVHKMSDEMKGPKFAFRSFGKVEFLNMRGTLESLEAINYVIQFKDLSFLQERKKIEEVKGIVTEIRHLKEDVKIILVYDYHYTLGLDKYLRQSNFKYFTSAGSSETENLEKVFGSKYNRKIRDFQRMFVQMTTKHKASFRTGPKSFFSYNYKNPFIVSLFWNNATLRYVVSPTRQWIDPLCSSCSEGEGAKIISQVPINQFCTESEAKFGIGTWKAAIKLELLMQGMNTYSKKVVQASRYLTRSRETKMILLEDLAAHYGLEVTRTALQKRMDGVLQS